MLPKLNRKSAWLRTVAKPVNSWYTVCMKTCSRCKQEKDRTEFYLNRSKKDGLSGNCKDCHKSSLKGHYQRNKSYYIAKSGRHGKRLTKLLQETKEKNPCTDCGKHYPYWVMDFDHISGEKVGNLSTLAKKEVSYAKVLQEIEKCEIVCANCHRTRTHLRAIGEMDDHTTLRR